MSNHNGQKQNSGYVREKLRIREMNESERPQEKLLSQGAKALDNAELVALILRTGSSEMNVLDMSRHLLSQHRGSLYELYQCISAQLDTDIKGIGQTKATMLMAAFELGVRLQREISLSGTERVKVERSKTVYNYLYSHFFGLQEEELWVLTINAGGFITSAKLASKGGVSETVADPKVILKHAIRRGAPAIILAHNHPGGTVRPSKEDDALTRKIAKACELLDIKLLDHMIFTDNGYYSYCDEGIL